MVRLQINLLPDIKLQANKQQHARNLVITGATLVSAACFAIFLLMAVTVYGIQKKQLSDSNQKIEAATAQLKKTPNLNRILTIQNQLKSLVSLHQSKHISSRVFTYLTEVTPTNITISTASLDLAANTLHLNGTADSQHSVNVFADTLKFTVFKMGKNGTSQQAFSSVVEDSFAPGATGVTYSLSLKFDPLLFSNSKVDSQGRTIAPILSVPKKTTTRSALDDPSGALFNGQTQGSQ